ncbi:MAG: dipeptide epimerase [Planctomycetes bacterium]|nr:dipeptide epimerase [Planctomycetota bacterium]
MKLTLRTYTLPLEYAFTTAHHSKTHAQTVIVELADGELRGYGEAPDNFYFNATPDKTLAAIESVREIVERAPLDPRNFYEALREPLSRHPFALCALDEAMWDMHGKSMGKPLWEIWGLAAPGGLVSDYTIGLDTLEAMKGKLADHAGWPVYKIKLGTDDDVRIVRELRGTTDAVLRVDANCAWSAEQTVENAAALAALNVEFIEQPMKADQWDAMEKVHAASALPIIADESCLSMADVERCAGRFAGVNVKLTKSGGLTPALAMLRRARELGLRTMVGCMTETTIGISAAAQLVPLLDYADMDGATLLAEDVATGTRLEKGRIVFTDAPGCGGELVC